MEYNASDARECIICLDLLGETNLWKCDQCSIEIHIECMNIWNSDCPHCNNESGLHRDIVNRHRPLMNDRINGHMYCSVLIWLIIIALIMIFCFSGAYLLILCISHDSDLNWNSTVPYYKH